ncbi:MAG: hypothetical protein ACK45Y_07970 [Betaproteobacteria bacterium]|jgi:hypothetical protein
MTPTTISALSTVSLALVVALVGAAMAWRSYGRRVAASDRVDVVVAQTEITTVKPTRRIAAISGADLPYRVSIRSVARQAAPYHTRPVERAVSLSPGQSSAAVPLVLAARRPGVAKQSTRIERRLAVVR